MHAAPAPVAAHGDDDPDDADIGDENNSGRPGVVVTQLAA